MDRDCNKCVYSTRDGGCRKWTCEGTKTVEDIRAEVIDSIIQADKNRYYCIEDLCTGENNCSDCRVKYLEKLKEQGR